MRKVLILLAILGLTGSLWASDPIIGSWKLDLATSTLSQIGPVQEQINTIKDLDTKYELTVLRIGTDGSKNPLIFTFPKQGGKAIVPQMFQSEGIEVVVSKLGPGDWCFTILQNDMQANVSHVIVAEDGKTAVEYSNGVDAQGQPYEGKGTFTKQ